MAECLICHAGPGRCACPGPGIIAAALAGHDYGECPLCGVHYDCDCPMVSATAPIRLRAEKAEADLEQMGRDRDAYQQNAARWETMCMEAEAEVSRLRAALLESHHRFQEVMALGDMTIREIASRGLISTSARRDE